MGRHPTMTALEKIADSDELAPGDRKSVFVDECCGHGLGIRDVDTQAFDARAFRSAARSGENAHAMSLCGKLFGDGPADGSGSCDHLEMRHDSSLRKV